MDAELMFFLRRPREKQEEGRARLVLVRNRELLSKIEPSFGAVFRGPVHRGQ